MGLKIFDLYIYNNSFKNTNGFGELIPVGLIELQNN